MRFFFHTSYNGSYFRGWQRQSHAVSVQATIEDQLALLRKKPCSIMGCGRTDALVHASQYYFHLDMDEAPDQRFLFKLNRMLPDGISIHEIIPVADHNHAQHSAQFRTYDYFFHTKQNPFISRLSAYYDLEIHLHNIISEALQMICTTTDFSSCCLTPLRHTSTDCKIAHAHFFQHQHTGHYRFQFKADHFLRGMIRILVGKLLLLGSGQMRLKNFETLLQSETQPQFLNQAYPQGLYLSKLEYPFLAQPSCAVPFQAWDKNEEWALLSGHHKGNP